MGLSDPAETAVAIAGEVSEAFVLRKSFSPRCWNGFLQVSGGCSHRYFKDNNYDPWGNILPCTLHCFRKLSPTSHLQKSTSMPCDFSVAIATCAGCCIIIREYEPSNACGNRRRKLHEYDLPPRPPSCNLTHHHIYLFNALRSADISAYLLEKALA